MERLTPAAYPPVMDRPAILRRLDKERRTLARDGESLQALADATRLVSADGSRHTLIHSALTAQTADAAIAREIAHYRELGAGFEWKVYSHDQPADLLDRLKRAGFAVGPHEAVLVYDLAQPFAWPIEPGSTVQRVDRPDQIAVFRQLAEAIFAKDYTFTATELAAALAAGSTQHRGYIAYAGDIPVSVGRLYTHPQSWFAGLYGGGTLPAWRGQGHYRALIAARARDAVALGARYLQVDALPTSRPILERLGFQWLTDTWPCDWSTTCQTADVG